jgi:hypothetical protein
MAVPKLPLDPPDASVPPAHTIPLAERRRLRLQRLPAGNFRLTWEAQGKSDYFVTYASVELGASTATATLAGMASLCQLVDERGLP